MELKHGMGEQPGTQVLIHYLLDICTPGEKERVESWMDERPEHVSILQCVARDLRTPSSETVLSGQDTRADLLSRLNENGVSDPVDPSAKRADRAKKLRGKRYRTRVRLAALILISFLSGLGSYYLTWTYMQQEAALAEARVEPGIQQSTVNFGQTATIRFGDGTVVQLNGGSTLQYPETFDADLREVWLKGEAFFTVDNDPERPFVVHTAGVHTQVLGTSFNIKAYENDLSIQVAVVDGKVSVTRDREYSRDSISDNPVLLEQNQWVTYQGLNDARTLVVEQGEGLIDDVIAWKDRVLVFNNKTLAEASRMLERWYGVRILIEDPSLKSEVINGEHHDISLEEVLNSIQFLLDFEYAIEGSVVRIH
ncbi:MAG: FecR domain-containing protein [Balneolaceae bacterium]